MASKDEWARLTCSLSPEIRETINNLGFSKPTPVQTSTIPLFAQNKDVVVEAVTGSGKTLAFLIPILEIMSKRKQPWKSCEIGAVVISPTRELAKQIGEALNPFLERFSFKKAVFTGGVSDSAADINCFRSDGGNIIIGTPGRLEDLLMKYPDCFIMKTMEVLVLDEADRLLDMGFERSLNNIISKLPKQRRTGLFSATMTNAVNELVRTGLRNPVKVTVKVESTTNQGEQKIPDSLKIFYHLAGYEDKMAFLLNYLQATHKSKTMIYFGTCACVDYYAKAVGQICAQKKSKLKFVALHGKMEHKRRSNVFKDFIESPSAVLLCTDLAARGLDFPDIDLVIQFDAPQDPTSFVHRCGRTARSGREGTALVILDPKEEAYIDFLEGRMIPVKPLPELTQEKCVDYNDILSALIKCNSSDRELYEKSLRAFVSYMRFYQEHHAKFIFNFKELDIGALARSFGLLHLPKMPELKLFPDVNFTKVDVDVSAIKFKDKARQKQRNASVARKASEEPKKQELVKRKASNEAWSQHKDRKERRLDRREKKTKKKTAIAAAKHNATGGEHVEESEDDGLDDDYRSLKKEKKKARQGKPVKGQLSDMELSDIEE